MYGSEKKLKPIHLRLTESALKTVRGMAAADELSVSQMVRRLLRTHPATKRYEKAIVPR